MKLVFSPETPRTPDEATNYGHRDGAYLQLVRDIWVRGLAQTPSGDSDVVCVVMLEDHKWWIVTGSKDSQTWDDIGPFDTPEAAVTALRVIAAAHGCDFPELVEE